ncbi:MAG: MgtC/SapB transporter [Lysobacterales bacterium RIFOXYD1_FULL_69_11]|nr:MAG: MgtC/SapB transporter [Xanthomonadales bacterium RIFOXYA1_FULL_69_10]OHE87790.1 MAG: MgtC/SapB transporter [Xanthomonadales bacterium RIFOXYD1_FULL_69_11]
MDWMEQLWIVAGVGYAMALGGVIGFERELRDRPAGFRTHMLVAGAAALLVGMERLVLEAHQDIGDLLQVDPLRLVEAVIAGVAFIGAGTIFARRGNGAIAGITTAASLLMVAVIGVTVGFGLHVAALAATMLTLVVLSMLRVAERRLHRRHGDDRER